MCNFSQESNNSAMQSPVFKSDTARQIAQEVGKVGGGSGGGSSGGGSSGGGGRRVKRQQQRSHTIGGANGANGAVAEALRQHQAKMAARSRDDLVRNTF